MSRHPFDPLSAVLGLLALLLAVLVITDRLIDAEPNSTLRWIAIGALALGLSLLPWGRRRVERVDAPWVSSPASPEEDPLERIEEE